MLYLLSKYVLLSSLWNKELKNMDITSRQCVSNIWELPSCKTFIPFTYLLDSVLQLVTLEKDDKHRLVHIIPLEQRKGCTIIAQLFTEISIIANYNRVLPFLPLNLYLQSSYLHSESRMYLNNTQTVTRKAIFLASVRNTPTELVFTEAKCSRLSIIYSL